LHVQYGDIYYIVEHKNIKRKNKMFITVFVGLQHEL